MGPLGVLGAIAGVLCACLCLRRLLCKREQKAFGTTRDDFKFSIDPTDFRSDGSRRLPDLEPADELDIDRELQKQLDRSRESISGSYAADDPAAGLHAPLPGEADALIGDLTDAHLNQEAFEAEMRAELAEFDKMAEEALPAHPSKGY